MFDRTVVSALLVSSAFFAFVPAGCSKPRPAFFGREDAEWISYEFAAGDTNLRTYCEAFGRKARAHGCSIDRVGDLPYSGRPRTWDGVAAHCGEADITLLVLDDERLAVGCRRPMTVEACGAFFAKIAGD